MNSQTGDIFRVFDDKTMEANFGKPLTLQEQMTLGPLPDTQERLRRYKQDHAEDVCEGCDLKVREHTLREWQHCEAVMSRSRLVQQLKP